MQLKEQDAEDGVPPQAPSAQLLRHLVAVSKGEQGDAEAVYSFAEVCIVRFSCCLVFIQSKIVSCVFAIPPTYVLHWSMIAFLYYTLFEYLTW